MNLVFTVVMLLMGYQLTVNRRSKREIKYLRNQVLQLSEKVFETNQHYEMILLYGKAETKKRKEAEETFKEEERLVNQQHTGEPPTEAPRESVSDGANL